MARGFEINKRAIEQMTKELDREFARHPVRVPIEGVTRETSGAGTVGNGRSDTAATAACILQWLYGRGNNESTFVTLANFFDENEGHPLSPVLREHGVNGVDALASEDLVRRSPSMVPSEQAPFMLTDAGRRLP